MIILILGALLGFISVVFGAYAEHGLPQAVTEEHFRILMTAIRYNQVDAVVIVAIGLGLLHGATLSHVTALKWSGLLFIIGTVLFSGSIYLSVSLDIPSLMKITPVGGITMMAAWLVLMVAGILAKKKL